MTGMEEFQQFVTDNEPELMIIYKRTREQIHGRTYQELTEVKEYASELLGYRSYVAMCLAKFNKLLDDTTDEHLPPKQGGMNDVDRKVKVEARVSAVRYWRNFCKGIVETIDRRISYAQSLLSFEKEYVNKIGAEHG